jgi:hypothetical protein
MAAQKIFTTDEAIELRHAHLMMSLLITPFITD